MRLLCMGSFITLLDIYCGDKRAYSYSCRSEVTYLVYLYERVKLVSRFEQLSYLIGGDSVKTTAEGIKLYEIELIAFANKFCGRVEP